MEQLPEYQMEELRLGDGSPVLCCAVERLGKAGRLRWGPQKDV